MAELEELTADPEKLWLWRQAMGRIQARERIRAHQDINAALNPSAAREFRLDLGEIAWDDDDPAYAGYVHGIASEPTTSTSE